MASTFDFNQQGLRTIAASGVTQTHLAARAKQVRDEARRNARSISPALAQAIEVEVGIDALGTFADIGYVKAAPGFVLWWHEVGTQKYPATPHLRPALKAGS